MFLSPINQTYDELAAWQLLIPESKYPGNFRNTLRGDKKPGCYFQLYNEKLYLMDRNYPYYHKMGVIELYAKEHGITKGEALTRILDRVPSGKTRYFRSERKPILFKPREWETKDTEFWKQFYLDKDDVVVIPIQAYMIWRRDTFDTYMPKMSYAYTFPSEHVKIYNPGQDPKFLGNVDNNDFFFFPGDKTCFVGASGKDCMVVHKFTGWTCIAMQSEMARPTPEFISLISKYDVVISLDGDEPGVESTIRLAKELSNHMDVSYFICPKFGRYKDYADLVMLWTPRVFINRLKDLYERRILLTKKTDNSVQPRDAGKCPDSNPGTTG